MSNAKPTDTELLAKLLSEYRDGYLKEEILERAIINIARHHVLSQGEVIREWLISGLLLTAGVLVLLWQPRYGFKHPSPRPALNPPSALKRVGAMQVATPHLLDDSPAGAYDFTLIQNNTTENAPVPAPCSGKIVQVWVQGKTGDLQTGRGGGNIVDLECRTTGKGWRLAHFHQVWVKANQHIEAGEGIGGQGCTGRCSGDHVHAQLHTLPDWRRIESRSITAPIVDAYLNRVRSGKWDA